MRIERDLDSFTTYAIAIRINEHSRISRPPAETARRKGPHDRIVMSSRVRLARNIKDAAFPGWAKKPERVTASWRSSGRPSKALPEMKDAFPRRWTILSTLDKQILVERHLISREHAAKSAGSGLVLNREEIALRDDQRRGSSAHAGAAPWFATSSRPGWPSTRWIPSSRRNWNTLSAETSVT